MAIIVQLSCAAINVPLLVTGIYNNDVALTAVSAGAIGSCITAACFTLVEYWFREDKW